MFNEIMKSIAIALNRFINIIYFIKFYQENFANIRKFRDLFKFKNDIITIQDLSAENVMSKIDILNMKRKVLPFQSFKEN